MQIIGWLKELPPTWGPEYRFLDCKTRLTRTGANGNVCVAALVNMDRERREWRADCSLQDLKFIPSCEFLL